MAEGNPIIYLSTRENPYPARTHSLGERSLPDNIKFPPPSIEPLIKFGINDGETFDAKIGVLRYADQVNGVMYMQDIPCDQRFVPTGFATIEEVVKQYQGDDALKFLVNIRRQGLIWISGQNITNEQRANFTNQLTTMIRNITLETLATLPDTRKIRNRDGMIMLNVKYTSPAYRLQLEALGIIGSVANLEATERKNFLQAVILKFKKKISVEGIIEDLMKVFKPEDLADIKRVVEFMGGAAKKVQDPGFDSEFMRLIRQLTENQDTAVVLPGTNSGIAGLIAQVCMIEYDTRPSNKKHLISVSVAPDGKINLPGFKPANGTDIYAVLPTDYILIIPGNEFGDETVLLVEHSVSLAIIRAKRMQQAIRGGWRRIFPNRNERVMRGACERIGVLANGGIISIDEVAQFIKGVDMVPDSQMIILQDSGRLAKYVSLIIRSGLVFEEPKKVLAFLSSEENGFTPLDESEIKECESLIEHGLLRLAEELCEFSQETNGGLILANVRTPGLWDPGKLEKVIYNGKDNLFKKERS